MTKPRTQVLAVVAASANIDNALESLDAIFASAVFDIAVSVLFMGDAISAHLMMPTKTPASGNGVVKQWRACDLYDIEALWVLASDLSMRNISPQALPANVQVLPHMPDASAFKHVLSL